ncbi:MAG: uroporphyrinogen-III synthase [Candidatus Binataceae bacterium]
MADAPENTAMPLRGRRIVVTRAEAPAQEFAESMRALGAEVLAFPTIEIVPPGSYAILDDAISRLESFEWLIFTSATGVDAFAARMKSRGHAIREIADAKVAAIGPATADRLHHYGVTAALVPSEYRAEAIAVAIGDDRIRDARFLIPRAQAARQALPELLAAKGAREVIAAPAYQTIVPRNFDASPMRAMLKAGAIDLVTFTSSSTVENFCAMAGRPESVKAAVIGPITAETARRYGFAVVIAPPDYTVASLTKAIAQYFREG